MKFPPSLLDDIRARLPVSQVVGRKVALRKAGREWKGLSPFKVEKTPSFYVNDQKGFYHCFASGEHGDIFKFLMETEGLTFPEAVERLADEAGVPMPKMEARDQEQEDRRQRLYKLLEASAVYFEQALKSAGGTHARQYIIEKRKLSAVSIAKFRLGYAPGSRNALKEHLAKLGFSNEDMIASGMLIGGDDIPVSYDRFRNRVMFPITDLKNRVIAFGGRALDADAPAKYLNSPETPLFHKGHILFHAAGARGPAHDRSRVIAVEGYMDVVALASAGFAESVAPLGTALTEDQVRLLWRMANEPILCFDGDSAGKKAAYRAIDVVLPQLVPGKSVRFAFLPDGLDPDDMIKQEGPEAMEGALGAARGLSDVLFEREWGQGDWSTPERRAQLERQLFDLVGRIGDATVRGYYAQDVRERLSRALGIHISQPAAVQAPVEDHGPADHGPINWDDFDRGFGQDYEQDYSPGSWKKPGGGQQRGHGGQAGPGGGSAGKGYQKPGFQKQGLKGKSGGGTTRGGRWAPPDMLEVPQAASYALRHSTIGSTVAPVANIPAREALLLRTLLNHPWLIEERSEDISKLEFSSKIAQRLRDGLLDLQAYNIPLDTNELRTQLGRLGFDTSLTQLDRSVTHKSDRFAEPDAERADVEAGFSHALRMHENDRLRHALQEAEVAYREVQSEDTLARLMEIKRLQARAVDADDRQS